MKILLAMSSPEYLRYFDETILALAGSGHEVVLAVNAIREGKPVRLDAIAHANGVVNGGIIPARDDRWVDLARAVRGTMDFVRYWHPELADASALRARVKRQALPRVLAVLDRVQSQPPARIALFMRALARIERAIPVAAPVAAFLDHHQPDLVLVSPVVEPASDQVDLVRAAQARAVPIGTLVASWDNLTNKGDLKVQTDRVFVWNERQRDEAREFHRVDPSRVAVTGSQLFDRWFERQPSRDRQAFCRDAGLPDDAPFVLFTGSSIFIARAEHEMPFVRKWIAALQHCPDPAVRALRILVRPHPYNGGAWRPAEFDGLPNVAVWPRGSYDPTDDASRRGLFDSLYFTSAVVGINTSAMIEAAIVGRPVLSITPPEFANTQGGTLHFRHLLPEHGGFLRIASTLEQHVAQLTEVIKAPDAAREELTRFVRHFIRPFGLAEPATPRLVAAIEACGRTPTAVAYRRTTADRLLATALLPATAAAGWLRPPASKKGSRPAAPKPPRAVVPPRAGLEGQDTIKL